MRFWGFKEIVKRKIVNQFDHATVFQTKTPPHVELAQELTGWGTQCNIGRYQPNK